MTNPTYLLALLDQREREARLERYRPFVDGFNPAIRRAIKHAKRAGLFDTVQFLQSLLS